MANLNSAYYTDQAAWLQRLRMELQPTSPEMDGYAKKMAQYHLLGAEAELRKLAVAAARREAKGASANA